MIEYMVTTWLVQFVVSLVAMGLLLSENHNYGLTKGERRGLRISVAGLLSSPVAGILWVVGLPLLFLWFIYLGIRVAWFD